MREMVGMRHPGKYRKLSNKRPESVRFWFFCFNKKELAFF